MNNNETSKKDKWRWHKVTSKKNSMKIFIAMLKIFPILVNIFIATLCIEWWIGYDIISKYIYPFIGDCFFIIAMFLFGSFAFSLCNIYRLWLLNMAIWLIYELFTNIGIIIPQFLIVISSTTIVTFITTLIILICRIWKKKKTNART